MLPESPPRLRLRPRHRPQTGSQAILRTAHRRLLVLAAIAVGVIVLFLSWGLVGDVGFVLSRRGTTVATMVLVGYAVAVSTVLFHTITANRILTPSIMGFDSLYVLIQTVMVAGLGAMAVSGIVVPVQFGIEVAVLVLFAGLLFRNLFTQNHHSLHLLLLVGIVFGVLFRSLSSFLTRLMDPSEFAVLQDRYFASFTGVDQTLLLVATVAVLAVSVVAWRMRHCFDVLALGRDAAVNLGISHRRTVTIILALVTVLIAVSTALVGPILFFGLLVANLAYQLMGTSQHRVTLPAAVLLAVISLVGGQFILQQVFALDTALSIIIEFLGGTVFIVLLLRRPAI